MCRVPTVDRWPGPEGVIGSMRRSSGGWATGEGLRELAVLTDGRTWWDPVPEEKRQYWMMPR